MECNITFLEDTAKWKQIYNKEKGVQDRFLGNAGSDWKWLGFGGFDVNVLCAARETEFKPIKGWASDASRN